jgi:uncharacterized protein (TIGR02145 family)
MKTKFFNSLSPLSFRRGVGVRLLFVLLISLPFGEGWGGVLMAQNGVTVSGLAVNAGTVTFSVSWNKDNVPAVWSDTVWVFADYSVAGDTVRLPLLPGATLTTHTAPGTGKVKEEPNNNKGVWVIGNARSAGSFSATVRLLTSVNNVGAVCVYASNYPPVGKYTAADMITFTGTPPYGVLLEDAGGTATTVQVDGNTYTMPTGFTALSFADRTGAPGIFTYMPPATYQPQGSCTYTEPAPVNTFADFPSNYSAATYVTLTDERDGKIYPVVQIGGRWWMARNLNYQTGLTWQANSNQPTDTGSDSPAIGHFWCPGTDGAAASTRASCDVWGALYAWETAMMVDGKWSDDNRNSSTWSEPAAHFGDYNTYNDGRGAGGHGICPPSWHVPTDFEWAVVLDAMEGDGTGTVHQEGSGTASHGSNDQTGAGARAKSVCNGTATDADAYWTTSPSWYGNDAFGFRVLPAGSRASNGSTFYGRGAGADFWSSSLSYVSSFAWSRSFSYGGEVYHDLSYRSYGFSVRCVRDE